MRRLLYLLREAVVNVLTNRTTTVVAVATTAFTFACVGVFLLLYVNLKALAASLEQDIQVMVYVQDDLPEPARNEIELQLRADRAVRSLTYVSKERALADFQAQFPSESRLLQGLGQKPCPRRSWSPWLRIHVQRTRCGVGPSCAADSRRRPSSIQSGMGGGVGWDCPLHRGGGHHCRADLVRRVRHDHREHHPFGTLFAS